MSKTNANDSAHPRAESRYVGDGNYEVDHERGLTKREYFAVRMMQAFIAAGEDGMMLMDRDRFAENAVKATDALIAELNKEKV